MKLSLLIFNLLVIFKVMPQLRGHQKNTKKVHNISFLKKKLGKNLNPQSCILKYKTTEALIFIKNGAKNGKIIIIRTRDGRQRTPKFPKTHKLKTKDESI
jgi:hypothetical protein